MNPKIEAVIKVYLSYFNKNIETNLIDYQDIIKTFIQLQQYWVESKIEIPKWKSSLDPLTTKAILHASSVKHLICGYTIPNPVNSNELKIIDIPSIYVIIRAQLENLLMIEYLYRNAKSESECEFRHNCWMYSGLLARIHKAPVSKVLKKQIEADKIQIQELKEKIENSSFFHKQLNGKNRKELFHQGSARLGKSWSSLAKVSKLNTLIFGDLYPILSNHAHSEALGAINLQEKKIGYHKNHEEGHLLLFISQIILCMVIKSFIKEFKVVEMKYNMINSDQRLLIDYMAKLGRISNNTT